MTAISSLRPFADSAEIAHNQRRAHASWVKVFERIIYFGPREEELESDQTMFFQCEDFPKIKTLVTVAGLMQPSACIINADIVVGDDLLIVLGQVLQRRGQAAVSRRYEFMGEAVERGALVDGDWGLDFFWAVSGLWLKLMKVIPPHFRIGHNSWDTYVLSFFNTVAPGAVWDITGRRCISHPKHDDRKRVYEIRNVDDIYTLRSGMPRAKL